MGDVGGGGAVWGGGKNASSSELGSVTSWGAGGRLFSNACDLAVSYIVSASKALKFDLSEPARGDDMGLSCGLFIQGITTDSRKRKSTHPSTKALAIAALCSTLEASNVCVFRIPSGFFGEQWWESSCSCEFQAPCRNTRSLLSFQSLTSRGLKLEASDWNRLQEQ